MVLLKGEIVNRKNHANTLFRTRLNGIQSGLLSEIEWCQEDSGGAMRSVGATLPLYLDVDPRSKRGST